MFPQVSTYPRTLLVAGYGLDPGPAFPELPACRTAPSRVSRRAREIDGLSAKIARWHDRERPALNGSSSLLLRTARVARKARTESKHRRDGHLRSLDRGRFDDGLRLESADLESRLLTAASTSLRDQARDSDPPGTRSSLHRAELPRRSPLGYVTSRGIRASPGPASKTRASITPRGAGY